MSGYMFRHKCITVYFYNPDFKEIMYTYNKFLLTNEISLLNMS